MIRIALIMIVAMMSLHGYKITPKFVKDGNYMGIRILDSKVLDFEDIDGLAFHEISDIAYDADNSQLYMLSDRARIFKFSIMIADKKIKNLTPLLAKSLDNLGGKKLLKPYRDSEGMALVGKKLYISFEQRPRIIRYSEKIHAEKSIQLPKILQDIRYYKGKNKALEALTFSPRYGMITTAEYPLKREKNGYHDIYTTNGKICAIKKRSDIAITEMEMMPDGNLLVLERLFRWRDFSFGIGLVKVKLEKSALCKSQLLAWMDTREGWRIDNFEGLTHIKDNLYLMISDDNNNRFEQTILTLFEIKE